MLSHRDQDRGGATAPNSPGGRVRTTAAPGPISACSPRSERRGEKVPAKDTCHLHVRLAH